LQRRVKAQSQQLVDLSRGQALLELAARGHHLLPYARITQQLQQGLQRLRESEERYRHLLERIQDGVVILSEGRIAYVNGVFARMAGVDLNHIPYKGAGPSLIALMGGEYQFNFAGLVGALPLARAGKIRAIAVTTEKRISGYEDIPTVKESGLPNFVVVGWYGVLTPPKMPKPLVTRLHAELVKVLNEPATNKRIVNLGGTPVGSDPESFRKFMLADMDKWADVVKKSGAKAE